MIQNNNKGNIIFRKLIDSNSRRTEFLFIICILGLIGMYNGYNGYRILVTITLFILCEVLIQCYIIYTIYKQTVNKYSGFKAVNGSIKVDTTIGAD